MDISNLKLNHSIRVSDVEAPNMEVMNSPRIPVASVSMTRALKQEESKGVEGEEEVETEGEATPAEAPAN